MTNKTISHQPVIPKYINFSNFKNSPDPFLHIFKTAHLDYLQETVYGRCLGYLLEGLKWEGEVNTIIQSVPHEAHQFDLLDLTNTMANLGYQTREIDFQFDSIDPRLLPCLFIPEQVRDQNQDPTHRHDYIIIVLSRTEDDYEVYNPQTQRVSSIPITHFSQGRAYFFTSLSNEELFTDDIVAQIHPNPYRWFQGILYRMKSQLNQGILLTFFSILFSILISLYIKVLYDRVINVKAIDTLYYLFPGILFAIGFDYLLRQMRSRIFSWFGTRLDNIMSPLILEKMLNLPPLVSESAILSSQIARMRDFEAIRDFCSGMIIMTLIEIPFTLLMILVVYLIAGELVFIPIGLLGIFVLLMLYFTPKIRNGIEESARQGTRRHNMTIETLDKLRALRTIGRVQPWFDQLRSASGVAILSNFQSWFLSSILETISYALYVIAGFGSIAFGIYLIITNVITAGSLIAAMLLIWRILAPLQTCLSSISVFLHFQKSVLQVHKLLLMKEEALKLKRFSKTPTHAPSVQISNLIFKHSTQPTPIFNGLNIQIAPGEIIMIIGRNGSGKTTLLKMLEGMYLPQVGSIKIDDMDIRQFNPSEYRRAISYVPEKPDIFQGTIAENLRIANSVATDDDIIQIFKNLGCENKIKAYSEGIHYRIEGSNQRISKTLGFELSLARAILRDAPIMLIDEAPHHYIHGEERHALEKYIQEWKGNKTTFIVANHRELLPLANRVIYLVGDGRILIGAPDEILKVIEKQFNFKFDE